MFLTTRPRPRRRLPRRADHARETFYRLFQRHPEPQADRGLPPARDAVFPEQQFNQTARSPQREAEPRGRVLRLPPQRAHPQPGVPPGAGCPAPVVSPADRHADPARRETSSALFGSQARAQDRRGTSRSSSRARGVLRRPIIVNRREEGHQTILDRRPTRFQAMAELQEIRRLPRPRPSSNQFNRLRPDQGDRGPRCAASSCSTARRGCAGVSPRRPILLGQLLAPAHDRAVLHGRRWSTVLYEVEGGPTKTFPLAPGIKDLPDVPPRLAG